MTLCNDARAFAIAEHQLGAARGVENVVAVTLGTGLGCGIITNGGLVHGRGELGHVKVNDSDTRCGCGLTGCLETVASATAIVREARAAIGAALWKMEGDHHERPCSITDHPGQVLRRGRAALDPRGAWRA